DRLREFRMRHASMVYQDPGAALNPTTKIGPQVVEAFTILGESRPVAEAHALEALDRVQIADPQRVMQRYPHQLSGGMQQRIVIGGGRRWKCHHIDRLAELVEPPIKLAGPETGHGQVTLSLSNVSKTFHQAGHSVPALVGIDLSLYDGETLGLVGESGSGKSTLARTILGIERPDAGSDLQLDQKPLEGRSTERPTAHKRSIQMVFQNPESALNRGW